jgi:hypothetical protein
MLIVYLKSLLTSGNYRFRRGRRGLGENFHDEDGIFIYTIHDTQYASCGFHHECATRDNSHRYPALGVNEEVRDSHLAAAYVKAIRFPRALPL